MKLPLFKFLIFVMSCAFSVVLFYWVYLIESSPEGWWDDVSAGTSKGAVFWCNHKKDALVMKELKGGKVLLQLSVESREIAWSSDGERLYLTRYLNNDLMFEWMDMTGELTATGVRADAFVESHQSGEVYLFEQIEEGGFEVRLWMQDVGVGEVMFTAFEGMKMEHGGIAGSAVSGDGRYIAIGKWGYNDPDGVEVWDLERKVKVLEDDVEASEMFFVGDYIYTVRSSAAIVQLHQYDMKSGERVMSSEPLSGSAVAGVSGDGGLIVIGRSSFNGKGGDPVEFFSTADLKKVGGVQLEEGARELVEVFFEEGEVYAIERGGGRWKVGKGFNEVDKVSQIVDRGKDRRPLKLLGAVLLLGLGIWWSVKERNRIGVAERGSSHFLKILMIIVGILELLHWLFVFGGGPFALINAYFFSIFNLVIGVSLVVYMIWIALLKLPEHWKWLGALTAFVAVSGVIGVFITVVAISAV